MYIKVSYKERDIAEVNIIHGNKVALLSICNGNKTRTKQKKKKKKKPQMRAPTRGCSFFLLALSKRLVRCLHGHARQNISAREREKKKKTGKKPWLYYLYT